MTSDSTKILLIEDDPNIVDLIRANLVARGYELAVVRDGSQPGQLLERHHPDLVLLDLMLPRGDGFEICRVLRESASVGIIVISARGAESDKVRALNLGADDYLTKPFGIDELLARINATLRRSRPVADVAAAPVILGDLVVDLTAQSVTRDGVLVRLTPTEFSVLRELVLHRGALVTHAQLLRNVWGPGYASNTEYVRVYMGRLRAKLEREDAPPLILTEPRAGYRIL